MVSYEFEDDNVIMRDVPSYGWLRKEDVLYYLMSTKECWENQIKSYKEGEQLYYDLQGRILALKMAIDEVKKA